MPYNDELANAANWFLIISTIIGVPLTFIYTLALVWIGRNVERISMALERAHPDPKAVMGGRMDQVDRPPGAG